MGINSKANTTANLNPNNANLESSEFASAKQAAMLAQTGSQMNSMNTTSAHNTLLQSRKEQTPGSNGNAAYPGMTNGAKIQKNPSGKDLMSH